MKWTKPGHVTFKVFSNNLSTNADASTNGQTNSKSKKIAKKFKLSQSNTSSNMSTTSTKTTASSRIDPNSFSFRSSLSYNDMKYINDSFNEYTDFNQLAKHGDALLTDGTRPFVFAAIKFESDFECSRFYEFYRLLSNNGKNEDLFNPSYKATSQAKAPSLIQTIYKKIAKNSISSPCAFHHINSLSITGERDTNDENDNDYDDYIRTNIYREQHKLESISDSQSLSSDATTLASQNDSSILFGDTLVKNKI